MSSVLEQSGYGGTPDVTEAGSAVFWGDLRSGASSGWSFQRGYPLLAEARLSQGESEVEFMVEGLSGINMTFCFQTSLNLLRSPSAVTNASLPFTLLLKEGRA